MSVAWLHKTKCCKINTLGLFTCEFLHTNTSDFALFEDAIVLLYTTFITNLKGVSSKTETCSYITHHVYMYLLHTHHRSCSQLSPLHISLIMWVLQNIFLTNSKRSKILQPDLSTKLASMNTSNPSFRNFTGYQ